MTHNDLCNKYIELSTAISALHTQVKAASDAYNLKPNNETLAALNQAKQNLCTANEQRAEIEKLLHQSQPLPSKKQ